VLESLESKTRGQSGKSDGRTDKLTSVLSFLITPRRQIPPDFPEPFYDGNQPKCLRQLAHRTELCLPLRQAQAAITAAVTAIPTATGTERARGHALRTEQAQIRPSPPPCRRQKPRTPREATQRCSSETDRAPFPSARALRARPEGL
jgi:hypothetical protein